jgi:uncharacterized protein YdaU (DUF1376 family)
MSSLKNAYMPFYIGDYLRKTQHLNSNQHGAYLNLLFHYWDNGKIEDNDDFLFKISKCERKSVWLKLRPVIEKFFIIEGGFWVNKRCDFERQKLEENRQKLSDAGKKSQQNRAKKPSENNQFCEQKNTLPILQPIDLQGNTSSQAETRLQQSTSTTPSSDIFPSTNISDTTTTSLNAVDVKKIEVSREKYKTVAEQVLHDCGDLPHLFMAPVLSWLENNCDPELDIFPTIRMAFAKNPNLKIRSLTYFDQPIMNAKAIRLRQLPSPKENHYATGRKNSLFDALAQTAV